MRKRLAILLLTVGGIVCLFMASTRAVYAAPVTTYMAAAQTDNACGQVQNVADTENQQNINELTDPLPKVGLTGNCGSDLVEKGLQLFFLAIGAIAVLIITVAGFRYIRAAGNPDAVSKAKDAIIYAAVGLAVALAAQAIIVFVFNYLIKS